MGSASISLVSAPHCHVRPWSRLFVHLAAPGADRRDVRGLPTLAQHHGDERCDRGSGRHRDMVRRRWAIPDGAPPNCVSCCFHRGLAVLRPASVRGHVRGRDWAWNPHAAALHGSSHYDLPGILRWFTANIGVHHIHHLCSRIPYYRLPDVLREHPELVATGRLTLLQSLRCVRLALWDEDGRRLISFRDMGRRYIRDCKVG